jgi:flagellar biosynthetic protein FliQ
LLVVGLLVGLLQAATQINDPAVGFLPRLVTGLLVAYFTGPWVIERLVELSGGGVPGHVGTL